MDEINLTDLQQNIEQIVKTVRNPAVIMTNGQPAAILMGFECFDILAEALVIVDDLEEVADQAIRVYES